VLLVSSAFVVAGCGGDSGGGNGDGGTEPDAATGPVLTPGGGIGGGPIDGELNVFVIDADDDSPIAGATVMVAATTAEAGVTATTDSTGLASFTDVSGPRVITVTADGYVTATWMGANGRNVTMPLDVSGPAPPPDTATATGTIAGWEDLPVPAADHVRGAFVIYSWTTELGDPANNIEQPAPGPGQPPPNLCIRTAAQPVATPCNWSLVTRTGPQAHFALIIDVDTQGTPTQGDDTFTIEGFAYLGGLDLSQGEASTGEVLELVPDTELTTLNVTFPTPPTGLDQMGAMPLLQLGGDGQLPVVFQPLDPDNTTALLPDLVGSFTGMSYDIFVQASAGTPDGASAIAFARDVDVSATVELPDVLDPPNDVSAVAGTYSFSASQGAELHIAEFRDVQDDSQVWNVALLDGRTTFGLPTVEPDPLPTGDLRLVIVGFDVPSFDPGAFRIEELVDSITGIASNSTQFTH
jgi:hypothetical protein